MTAGVGQVRQMAHISPSFRRAYRTAKRQGFGREALRSGQGLGPVSVWRALGWPAKAVLGASAVALILFIRAPAEAASNDQPEIAPLVVASAPAETALPPAAAPVEPAVTEVVPPDATRPSARPATLGSAPTPPVEVVRGPVTRLPLPRYVSLKGEEGNVRRGPSLSHRIDWVFHHSGMPLRVVGEFGHWRRVEDRDGAGGWVHYSLLSGVRTVIVDDDMLDLHLGPDPETPVAVIASSQLSIRVSEKRPSCRGVGDKSAVQIGSPVSLRAKAQAPARSSGVAAAPLSAPTGAR